MMDGVAPERITVVATSDLPRRTAEVEPLVVGRFEREPSSGEWVCTHLTGTCEWIATLVDGELFSTTPTNASPDPAFGSLRFIAPERFFLST